MKYLLILLCLSFIVACNQSGPDKKALPDNDTTHTNHSQKHAVGDTTAPESRQESLTSKNSDSFLLKLSAEILATLKTKDLAKLSSFVHPASGLRFSPYGYIDTPTGKVMHVSALNMPGMLQKTFTWGEYDGTGKIIKLSADKYFDRFVYSKDFLNAEKKSANKTKGRGNASDNLEKIYPDASYTEFYFSGFDPKYEGMDWQKLQLLFRIENGRPYLIAIVHDEWTI